jgi:hypothetical protein
VGLRLDTEVPKPTKADAVHTIVKAGLGAIPYVGSAAAETFAAIIVPPLTRRRDEWIKSIADGLNELQAKVDGFKIENLANNETFITTVMYASQVAIRNHQKEKLGALRNAVINSALGINIDEDNQQMFLEYVDSLTPSHLKVLSFLDDPRNYGQRNGVRFGNYMGGAVSTILEEAIPELRDKRAFYDQLFTDLSNRGLTSTDRNSMHAMMTESGMFDRRTTDTGRVFLKFITSPI